MPEGQYVAFMFFAPMAVGCFCLTRAAFDLAQRRWLFGAFGLVATLVSMTIWFTTQLLFRAASGI